MYIPSHVARLIRQQQRRVKLSLERLSNAAQRAGAVAVVAESQALGAALDEHIGLVTAVLDAVSEDEVSSEEEP